MATWLLVDVLAVAPFFLWPVSLYATACFAFKCVRFLRFSEVFPFLERLHFAYANLWRLVYVRMQAATSQATAPPPVTDFPPTCTALCFSRLLLLLILFAHWTACLWWIISDTQSVDVPALPWTHMRQGQDATTSSRVVP